MRIVNESSADEGLTEIISAIDMAVEKLCHIDPEWERSNTVKRGISAVLYPYYVILQEKKKNSKHLTLHSFLMSSERRPWPSSAN